MNRRLHLTMPCAARVRPLLAAGFGPPSAAPAAWYLTSTPRFPGSGRPRSLWSARLPGAGYPLDHSLWRANAHNQAVPPGPAPALGVGNRSPAGPRVSRQLSWDLWADGQALPFPSGLRGWPPPVTALTGVTGGRVFSSWGAYAAEFGGPRGPISPAADRTLGNSVGAIESVVGGPVAFCATGAFGWVAALGRLPSCTVTQTFRPPRGASRCASRAPGSG